MDLKETLEKILGEEHYEFYRCYRCGELISAIELAGALVTSGVACKCGCMKIQPSQVKPSDYARKNVMEMAIRRGIDQATYTADFMVEAADMPEDERQTALDQIQERYGEVLAACA